MLLDRTDWAVTLQLAVGILRLVVFHVAIRFMLQLLRIDELGRIVEIGRDVVDRRILATAHQSQEYRHRDHHAYHRSDHRAIAPGLRLRLARQENREEADQGTDNAQQKSEREELEPHERSDQAEVRADHSCADHRDRQDCVKKCEPCKSHSSFPRKRFAFTLRRLVPDSPYHELRQYEQKRSARDGAIDVGEPTLDLGRRYLARVARIPRETRLQHR